MTTRLADTRTLTLDDARAAFADLAQARLRMERRAAAAECRIATIKAGLAAGNAEDDAALQAAEARLTAFILAHPEQFRKPRQVRTEFGRFGLRDATRLEVTDEDRLIEALMEAGYDDCMEVRRRVVKDKVRERIAGGERLPGVRVETGDLVTYTIDRALIDKARGEEVAS